MIVGKNFSLRSDLNNKNAYLCDSLWHPQFGVDIPNKALVIDIISKKTVVTFEWNKKL